MMITMKYDLPVAMTRHQDAVGLQTTITYDLSNKRTCIETDICTFEKHKIEM